MSPSAPINNRFQLAIELRVEQCLIKAESILQQKFSRPKISFNQRGKIAGCARLQTNELKFNPILLNDNLPIFLQEVVPHEICHLLAFALYGKVKPHGVQWKSLMENLYDLPGTTYHCMDVAKVIGTTFVYRCACGPVELGIRRHNKVIRNQQKYLCRQCRSPLERD